MLRFITDVEVWNNNGLRYVTDVEYQQSNEIVKQHQEKPILTLVIESTQLGINICM